MSDVKSTCLRFNLAKPIYRQAWEIMQKSGKSYSQTVAAALIEYDERHSRLDDDPYFENREREDRFVDQIISAVEQSLEKALPGFMAACLMNMIQPYNIIPQNAPATAPEQPESQEFAEESIDWDFIGS